MVRSRGWERDVPNRTPTILKHENSSFDRVQSDYNGESVALIVALAFLVLALLVIILATNSGTHVAPVVPTIIASQSDSVGTIPMHSATQKDVVLAPRNPTYRVGRESLGEAETRAALERIFGKAFVKVRPAFLTNPESHRKLELDCFNAELRLGVEYSGIQHFVFPNVFHKTQQEFDAQQRRDRYKAALCQQAGVRLIVVPYTIARDQIEAYLREKLQVHNDLV